MTTLSTQVVVVFSASQNLSQTQLDHLRKEFDKVIQSSLPCEDRVDYSDVPEFTSDCSIVQTEDVSLLDIFKDILKRMNPWRTIHPISLAQ